MSRKQRKNNKARPIHEGLSEANVARIWPGFDKRLREKVKSLKLHTSPSSKMKKYEGEGVRTLAGTKPLGILASR